MKSLVARTILAISSFSVASAALASSGVNVAFIPASATAAPPARIAVSFTSVLDAKVTRRIDAHDLRATFHEVGGSQWDMRIESESWWIAPQRITVPTNNAVESLNIRIWKLSTVTATVATADKSLQIPPNLELWVEPPPFAAQPATVPRDSRFLCPVAAGGRLTCRVPQVRLDYILKGGEVAPVYITGVEPSESAPRDLGAIQLKKGGAVVAWIDRRVVSSATTPIRARLVRLLPPEAMTDRANLFVPVAEALVGKTGILNVTGVPTGTYVLEVLAAGYAPTRVSPLSVYSGKPTVVTKLIEPQRPIAVKITVDPAADSHGAPWTVSAFPRRTYGSGIETAAVITKRVSRDGTALLPDQVPGTLTVNVKDGSGQVLAQRDFQISSAADADVRIQIEQHSVRGRLTLADEPFPATLWFGGRKGAVAIRLTANDDGEFSGSLPRTGSWRVEILNEEKHVRAVRNVTVPSDGEVNIRISSSSITGRVISATGSAVPGARVNVSSTAGLTTFTADENGRFEISALPAAEELIVSATDPRSSGSSSRMQLQLRDGETRPVELRILPFTTVSGVVVDGAATVPAARILGVATDFAQPFMSNATADVNGAFELSLPDGSRVVQLIVSAPGHTFRAVELPTEPQPIRVNLDSPGGTVVIKFPKTEEGQVRILENGIVIPLPELIKWVLGHGSTINSNVLTIPNMSAGLYQACRPTKRKCVQAGLSPMGSITLDLE